MQPTELQPTHNYLTFFLAQELKKTVRELLTGAPGPLMGMEHYLWRRWRLAERRLEQQRNPKKR